MINGEFMGAAKVHGKILIYERAELRWIHQPLAQHLAPMWSPLCPHLPYGGHEPLSHFAAVPMASSCNNTAYSQSWSSFLSCKASKTSKQIQTWALHPSACWLCLSQDSTPFPPPQGLLLCTCARKAAFHLISIYWWN